jgi:AcrR family transcriptional regulator
VPALSEKQPGARVMPVEMAAAPEKIDGRRERTKRTRAAIVAALTELLDEGRIEPTAAEIAERASVAVRSIGQHFASREELLLAVAEHHASRLARPELDAKAVDVTATFEERIESFVRKRVRVLEASRMMRGAAAVVMARSPAVAKALERVASQRRAETAHLFASEIAESADPEATERAVALLTSGRSWDALRGELDLSQKSSQRQLTSMLKTILAR